jgi:hypothetical protein
MTPRTDMPTKPLRAPGDVLDEESPVCFAASRRLAIAVHLGIAVDVLEGAVGRLHSLRGAGAGELLWPAESELRCSLVSGRLQTGVVSIPVFTRVLDDPRACRLLAERGGTWAPVGAIVDGHGARLGSIWKDEEGNVLLPFDPDEVCHTLWSERYLELLRSTTGRRRHRLAMRSYYAVRRLLPRALQIRLRRLYARRQAAARFPGWPVESALHDYLDLFTSILADVNDAPVARIAPWPEGHDWALVLTHDVETAEGLAARGPVLELERELSLRSAWNLVPRRYEVDPQLVSGLNEEGFEVGVHGLYHDGRDLESPRRLGERLAEIRATAERWGAVGFRSPATVRAWELMPRLGFDYDSSSPDTDPFEPVAGGCCSWLPFFNEDLVELPLTMPQDFTLFVILDAKDETAWVKKAELLRSRGGMVLLDTHPDYLVQERILSAYRRLLERLAPDGTCWQALPRDVSAWWRRRAASRVEFRDGTWIVTGPAAGEATVELSEGRGWS